VLRTAALHALQRKKLLERELDRQTNMKTQLETQVFGLENANINLETMKAMQAGANAMKGIHGTLYLCRRVATNLDRLIKLTQSWMRFAIKWPCQTKSATPFLDQL
jgi:Snf7